MITVAAFWAFLLVQDPVAQLVDEVRRMRSENQELKKRIALLENQSTENARTLHRLRQALRWCQEEESRRRAPARPPLPPTPAAPALKLTPPEPAPPAPVPPAPAPRPEEAADLLRRATPLYQEVARLMEEPPSDAAARRSLLTKAQEAERLLADAESQYRLLAAQGPDAGVMERRARSVAELLTTLRRAIETLRK